MTSNDVSTCSGFREGPRDTCYCVTMSRSCDLLLQVGKCLVRYLSHKRLMTGRSLGGVTSLISDHYYRSNPSSPKFKSPRPDLETI